MASDSLRSKPLVPADFRGFWIDIAARNAIREYNRLLRPHGITSIQYFALLLLAQTPGLRPSELASELRIEGSSLTGHLDRLQALGLIARTIDPDDRRVYRLELSPRGSVLVDALAPVGAVLHAYEPGVAIAAADAPSAAAATEAQRALETIAEAFRDVSAAFAKLDVPGSAHETIATIADRVGRRAHRANGPVTLRVATLTSRESPVGRMLAHFAQLVDERTRGRVRIELELPARAHGGELQMLVEVRSGDCAIASVTSSVAGNLLPDAQLLELPYLVQSFEHAARFVAGPFCTNMLREAERFGLAGLGVAMNGFRSLTTRDTIVRSPSDLLDLRLRVQQSPINVYLAEAFGAVAVPIPFPRLAEALCAREVDAQENALANIAGLQLWESQRYLALTKHAFSTHVVLAHAQTLARLGARERAVRSAMADALAQHRFDAERIERDILAQLARSFTLLEVSPDDERHFHAAARLVYERMTFLLGPEPLDRVRAAAFAAGSHT